MKQEYRSVSGIERLLGYPPDVRDNGFTGCVLAHIAGRERLRKQVFAAVAATWLVLFFALVPLFTLGGLPEHLRQLGNRIGSLGPVLLNIEPIHTVTQPGAVVVTLIALSALYALVSSQFSSH